MSLELRISVYHQLVWIYLSIQFQSFKDWRWNALHLFIIVLELLFTNNISIIVVTCLFIFNILYIMFCVEIHVLPSLHLHIQYKIVLYYILAFVSQENMLPFLGTCAHAACTTDDIQRSWCNQWHCCCSCYLASKIS